MTKDELKYYLADEAEYDVNKLDEMDEYDLIDAYLTWEGILGYTDDIIDTVRRVFGDVKDDDESF